MIVVEGLRGQFGCPICYLLLKDPVTTVCGHTFCRSCISKCSECPLCKKSIDNSTHSTTFLLSNVIEGLSLFCPSHFDENTTPCEAKDLKPSTIESHVRSCEKIPLKCLCGKIILRKDFLNVEYQCNCPYVRCTLCSQPQQERTYSLHMDTCKHASVKCEVCGENYVPKDKPKHESEECYVLCPFHEMGCNQKKILAKKYEQHLEESKDAHFVMLSKVQYKLFYHKLMKQIENTGKRIQNPNTTE